MGHEPENTDGRPHILRLTPGQWKDWFTRHGQPQFRASQVLDWIYNKSVIDPAGMTNLSEDLRSLLAAELDCIGPALLRKVVSKDGATSKFAFRLGDGEVIESVLMESGGRFTFCISTQAGCAQGCRFCATARGGFKRNLSGPEIAGQVLRLARECGGPGNVVFMGMGEPLLNMNGLIQTLETLVDPDRFGLGSRRITVSTVGIIAGIRRLARHRSRPNLALSLNSPFDKQRSELMPAGRKNPLSEVIESCEEYAARTGRRIMLEYVMIGGVNTSGNAAAGVADIAGRLGAAVNLIAFNRFDGCNYRPPGRGEIREFQKVLERKGVVVTQRYRRGGDIAAGCGQLSPHIS